MGEKELRNPETIGSPIEVKFGDIVELSISERPGVITGLIDEGNIFVSLILSDIKGEEELGSPGTISAPIKDVLGHWETKKVIEAFLNHFRNPSGEISAGLRDSITAMFEAEAQKPPVLYRGE